MEIETVKRRPMISIMDASSLVGVSRRTIYNWIARGKVEYVRTAGGAVRIFTDTLYKASDISQLRVRRVCHVSGPTCIAPAGINAMGSCRGTCAQCSRPVCAVCSEMVRKENGAMRRICTHCTKGSAHEKPFL